jgi:hypothetical protein
VQSVRGQSMFGMSFVYVIFEDGTDLYWARSRVLEYLNEAQARLPEGVTPTLGPDATGVGWVFEYALVDRAGTHDLAQLRALQDFTVRYAVEGVPGVAEVASVGGFEKEYQVAVDPVRLRALGVTLDDVMRAVRRSNVDVGGQSIEIAGHEHVVRGRGYVRSVHDLEVVPVKVGDRGVPIFVREQFRGKSGRGLYGDVVQELDWGVGEILKTLKRLGLEENTLVVFSSDNGPFLSYGEHAGLSGPLREGKLTTFEGGHRTPCLVRWLGKIPAGRVSDAPWSMMDFHFTLTKLIGATPANVKLDGTDMLPLLTGQPGAKGRDEYYFY